MKIRTKLFLLLTALSLLPLVLLGIVSTYIARDAVEGAARDQLTKVRDELTAATTRNAERAARIGREIASDQNFALYLTYLGSKDVRFLEPIMRKVLAYHMEQDGRILGIVVRYPGGIEVAARKRSMEAPVSANGPGVVAVGEDAFCVTVPAQAGPNSAAIHVLVARDWFTVEIDAAAVAANRPVAGFLVADGRMYGASAHLNSGLLELPYATEPWLQFGDRVAAVGPVEGTPFHVGASMGEDEFLAPVLYVRNASFVLVVLVALLVVAASFGFATTIVRPIASMVAVARRVAGGDLDARVLDGHSAGSRQDELGELARDLDAMTGRLKATIGDLDRRVRELTTLYEASAVINQSEDLKEVLTLSGELLASGFGVTRAAFLRADESAGRFVPVHWHGPEAGGFALPATHPAVRRAFSERVAVEIENAASDAELKAVLSSGQTDSQRFFLVVPVMASRREVGLIVILDAQERPDEEDRRLFAVLSSLIAPLFVTAGPSRSRVVYEGMVEELEKLLERVERMDSRCTGAAIQFTGDPNEAARVASRVLIHFAGETAHVYRATPTVLLAFYPGLSPLEVEAAVTKTLVEKEPSAGFTIRAASFPEDAGSAEELVTHCLAGK